jgi:hypothetical protein
MTLLARGQSRTLPAGTRSTSPVVANHVRVDTRVPVMCHDQGSGQNGAFSSKKTKTGITAQPTMSWTR